MQHPQFCPTPLGDIRIDSVDTAADITIQGIMPEVVFFEGKPYIVWFVGLYFVGPSPRVGIQISEAYPTNERTRYHRNGQPYSYGNKLVPPGWILGVPNEVYFGVRDAIAPALIAWGRAQGF